MILLFDTESYNSSMQMCSVLVGTNYLSFHNFFLILDLKDSSTLSTTFCFGGMYFNNHSPKSLIFCIPIVKMFFVFCMFLAAQFLIFCLTFVETFDVLQGVVCKTGMGSFGIGSSNMLLFCSTNLVVSTQPFWAYNNLLYLALLRWLSIALLYDSPFLFMKNICIYDISSNKIHFLV